MTKRKFVTINEMRRIDRDAIKYGMPIEMMMENAGRSIANQAIKKAKKLQNKRITIVAGKGNNGGGVIAAARHISSHDFFIDLIMLHNQRTISDPSKLHFHLIRKNPKISVSFFPESQKNVFSRIAKSRIIIDGIFGTGFDKKISESLYSLISKINESNAYVISNDVPSGINADTGKIDTICIKANFVIVLHKPKKWMSLIKTPKFSVVNIGIPPEIDTFLR